MRALTILAISVILSTGSMLSHPSAAAEPVVDRMTCPDAQRYARTHGHYWMSSRTGPPVRITGYRPDPTVVCTGRDYLAPHFEMTGDGRRCVLGWYCHLM